MGREDQIEEREVLDSIFPDEITDISENEFRLSILLDVINDDGDDSEPPTMILTVRFPDEYPEISPVLDLSSPPNNASHPYLDVTDDKAILLSSLDQTIEENLGMQMIFTLYSTIKESAEALIAERQAEARAVQEARILAQEQEENKKFHGTPVTPETFTSWRAGFRKEMEELKEKEMLEEEAAEKKRNRGKVEAVGLTGKQLWERGMVGKIEESDDEDDELPVKEVAGLKV